VLVNNAGVQLTRTADAYAAGDTQWVMMINAVCPNGALASSASGNAQAAVADNVVNVLVARGCDGGFRIWRSTGASKAALHHYTAGVQRELAFTALTRRHDLGDAR